MMNDFVIKNVRSLNLHFGRLTAIKWTREARDLSYEVARMAVDDIIQNQPWTRPHIKADLNTWELGNISPVR